MTYPFDQATALFKANCTLAARLSQIAQASGREWVKAGTGSMARLASRQAVIAPPASEAKSCEPGADGVARLASSMSENLEEAGAAVAEWQSSCVSALLGKPEEGPGDFLRYTAWAWRPAVASERDGQDAQSG